MHLATRIENELSCDGITEKVEETETKIEKGTLVSRNITVLNKRTSVRLEPEMWIALKDIALREKCKVNELCSLIYLRKNGGTSLTAAIRVFLMLYFRAATTEEGHTRAGHGNFSIMKKRARLGDVELNNIRRA